MSIITKTSQCLSGNGVAAKTLGMCLVTAEVEVGFAVKSESKLRMRHWRTQTCLLISRAGLTIRYT